MRSLVCWISESRALDRGGRDYGFELDLFPGRGRIKVVCDTISLVGEDACEVGGGSLVAPEQGHSGRRRWVPEVLEEGVTAEGGE